MIFTKDNSEAATEKPLRITGSSKAVETAKQLVTGVLANIGDRDSFGRGNNPSRQVLCSVWLVKKDSTACWICGQYSGI